METNKELPLHFFKCIFYYDANKREGMRDMRTEIKVFSAIDDTELQIKIDSHIKASDKKDIYLTDIIKP